MPNLDTVTKQAVLFESKGGSKVVELLRGSWFLALEEPRCLHMNPRHSAKPSFIHVMSAPALHLKKASSAAEDVRDLSPRIGRHKRTPQKLHDTMCCDKILTSWH